MTGCVLTDPTAISRREQTIAAALSVGTKLRPVISEFCEYHKQYHAIQIKGEASAAYQNVNLSREEEKQDGLFQHKEYCRTCASYHIVGECRGPRTKESVGT